MVDSTCFANGFDTDHGSSFWKAYNGEAIGALPLAAVTPIHQTGQLIESAGFTNVTVTPLLEVL